MISATGSFCNHAAAICGQHAAQRLLLNMSCGVNGAPIFPGIAARAAELGAERHDSLAKLLNTNPPVMGEASAPKRLDQHKGDALIQVQYRTAG